MRKLSVPATPAGATAAQLPPVRRPVRIFDGTDYTDKPGADFARRGIEPILVTGTGLYAGEHPNFDTTKPDEAACRRLAREAAWASVPVVLDVEHWPVDIRKWSTSLVAESLANLVQAVEWMHDEAPTVQVGYFGLLPISDYWTAVKMAWAIHRPALSAWHHGNRQNHTEAYVSWVKANGYLAPLAHAVDFVCPVLYTHYNTPIDWLWAAEVRLHEARRCGRPLYPFVWPEYTPQHRHRSIERWIDGDFWRRQLELTLSQADGLVIWGGWEFEGEKSTTRMAWDPDAPWWGILRDVIAGLARR